MHARLARHLLVAFTLIMTESLMAVETQVVPDSYKLVFGKVVAGDVGSLAQSDGNVLRLCRFTVPNSNYDPIWFNVEAPVPVSPTNLKCNLVSKSLNFGTYSQTLFLFDFQNRLFDPNTAITSTMAKSNFTMTCSAVGSSTKYWSTDHRVRALVRAKCIGMSPVFGWQVEYDKAWFAIGSGP